MSCLYVGISVTSATEKGTLQSHCLPYPLLVMSYIRLRMSSWWRAWPTREVNGAEALGWQKEETYYVWLEDWTNGEVQCLHRRVQPGVDSEY